MHTLEDRHFTTAEVAAEAGIHRDTLLRWLRQNLVTEPSRDRHGWRLFKATEAAAVVQFAKEGVAPFGSPSTSSAELDALDKFDWSFSDAKTSYLTHGLHPYPAKFIPQIPNALIQELSSVGETVVDIFCGSGTTLVEALTLKRNAVGVDASPLACLISEAKTTRLEGQDRESLTELIARVDGLAERLFVPSSEPLLFQIEPFKSKAWRPESSAIQFWFEAHVVEELAEVLSWCRGLSTAAARKLSLAAFSAIVVGVSKQDSDTRYVRREKNIRPGDTCRRFSRSLSESLRSAIEMTDLVEPRFHSSVVEASVLDRPDIGPCDLVVCSPPYPNAYSYHLYHMTRMVWLGMDQPRFKTAEIGSHRKYSKKKNGESIETFAAEMKTTLEWLRSHLRTRRFACFVIGDSIIAGQKFDNASLLAKVASEAGFTEVKRLHRTLRESRKSFNPSYGKIKTEHVVVLRRD